MIELPDGRLGQQPVAALGMAIDLTAGEVADASLTRPSEVEKVESRRHIRRRDPDRITPVLRRTGATTGMDDHIGVAAVAQRLSQNLLLHVVVDPVEEQGAPRVKCCRISRQQDQSEPLAVCPRKRGQPRSHVPCDEAAGTGQHDGGVAELPQSVGEQRISREPGQVRSHRRPHRSASAAK